MGLCYARHLSAWKMKTPLIEAFCDQQLPKKQQVTCWSRAFPPNIAENGCSLIAYDVTHPTSIARVFAIYPIGYCTSETVALWLC